MKTNLDGFKIRGEVVSGGDLCAAGKRSIDFLEKLPFKELVTTRELAANVGVKIMYFRHVISDAGLRENRFLVRGSGLVWGSRRTIKELKRVNKANR